MLIEFFLERARIELMRDGLSYRGRVLDLPEIDVTAATPDECRAKLAESVSRLLTREAQAGSETEPATSLGEGQAQVGEPLAPIRSYPNAEPYGAGALTRNFTDIIYEKNDWVARVTINRPTAYNSYTDHTLREMTAAFRDAADDNSVAVLVLTGAGDRAFCAGGDVQQHREEHIGKPQAFRKWEDALIEAHTSLRRLGKPSIARINGMAAGGGNDWNLACDLAIAADHAKFVQIETKVGVASASAAHLLPLLIGERRARELFLTGEPISANKALLWGLVNDVVPYKQLDKTVDALCKKLIDRFPDSTHLAREQLSSWKVIAWESMIKESRDDLAAQFTGEEAREGFRALVEKREVDYRRFRSKARDGCEREKTGAERVTRPSDRTVRSRSCYSCGARDIPESSVFCGLCGTRLV